MEKHFRIPITPAIVTISISLFLLGGFAHAQSACDANANFFETLGGSSSDLSVKGINGCKTLYMDSGFEKITIELGSIPEGTAEYSLVQYSEGAEPGQQEIAVNYYYYAGNETETCQLEDAGASATVCNNNGAVTIKWSGVKFRMKVNGNILVKTACEMTCRGAAMSQPAEEENENES